MERREILMFYKAVKDGKIVDVFSDSDIVYVRLDSFLNKHLRCKKNENPVGVLSSDVSSIYMFSDTPGYDTIILKEFEDEAEYNTLKSEIDAARTPEYIEPSEPDDEQVDTSTLENAVITAEEALNIIMGVYE